MTRPIFLRPEAEADIESGKTFYDVRGPELGTDFLQRVSDALDVIQSGPERYAQLWRTVRAFRIRRFPFVIYYRVQLDRIEVLAILHGQRDASVWRKRI